MKDAIQKWFEAKEKLRALRELDEHEDDEEVDVEAEAAIPGTVSPEAPSLDARRLTDQEFEARLASMGIDSTWHERRLQPPPRRVAPEVAAAVERHRVERKRLADERVKALEVTRLDARTATPAQMRARLAEMGLAASTPPGMFSSVPPKPPPTRTDPATVRRRAEAEAEIRVRRMLKAAQLGGTRIDARTLNEFELAAHKKLRGLGPGIEVRAAVSGDIK
jgi:hypothetical protein